MANYSAEIENWHNNAHIIIGEITGTDMMNPFTNVFLREFWNFHFFINERFEKELRSYSRADHPELSTPTAIVQHIENQHHRVVNSI